MRHISKRRKRSRSIMHNQVWHDMRRSQPHHSKSQKHWNYSNYKSPSTCNVFVILSDRISVDLFLGYVIMVYFRYIYIYVYLHIYICIYMHIYRYIYIFIHTHIHIYGTCVNKKLRSAGIRRTSVSHRKCSCIYIHVYICIYIYIYIYMYIYVINKYILCKYIYVRNQGNQCWP
jgi:hypothetical protein